MTNYANITFVIQKEHRGSKETATLGIFFLSLLKSLKSRFLT